jgi:hypothetical protein
VSTVWAPQHWLSTATLEYHIDRTEDPREAAAVPAEANLGSGAMVRAARLVLRLPPGSRLAAA